jgi:GWxTD domain-containing protein
MRASVIAIGLLAGFASAAFAELSDANRAFMAGPAGFIATKAEKKAFEKLASDADAERFIELFWVKRDPDLATQVNEFKVDFDLRVTAADKQFSTERMKGSLSDRGRTLIIMGRPFGISYRAPDSSVQTIGSSPAGEHGVIEVWTYRRNQIPPTVKSEEIFFIFVETRIGAKDFPLDREERRNAVPMKLLADAPERLLLHPDLKQAPRVGLLAGSRVASPAELAVLAVEPRPWPQGAQVRAAQGVQSGSLFPLWIHVRLPEATPLAAQLVGRAISAAGEEAGSFAAAANAINVPGGRAYELSLPLGAGAWKVELALLGTAGPIAVTTVAAELEAVPAEQGWISPMYWGAEVRQESRASLGDPFDVGGWHVLPQPGDRYSRQESLGYFCIVVRPGLSAEHQPAVQTSMAFFLAGKKLNEVGPEPASLSQVAGDVWMFGASLPFANFPALGEYTVEVTLHDTISGLKRTTRMPASIVTP